MDDALRADVPTCAPADAIGTAWRRTFDADWDECIVIDCDNIVVGRLRNQSWDSPADVTAESAMEPGPTTVRPDADLASLVERMSRRGTRLVVAATPQGQLLGTVSDTDARQLVAGHTGSHDWQECDGCPGQRRATSGPQTGEDGAQ